MADRISLNTLLRGIVDHVYYQPPSNVKLEYPCIIYEKANNDAGYANNKIYNKKTHYTLMYLTRNADDTQIEDALLSLEYCSYDRLYVSDNIYHNVFDLYY